MITIECPWCAGPAHIEGPAHADLTCATCDIVVEIAPDAIRDVLEHAA